MERFWPYFLRPLATAIAPSRIIQVGAESGALSKSLADFCVGHDCALDILDPEMAQLDDFPGGSGSAVRRHAAGAATAIPLLPAADLLIWDGDRNWVTVYGMLQVSFARAVELNSPPPVVALHHTGWPWGRRDSYARPASIAADDRHQYAARGMRPGVITLCDDGWSGQTLNALEEGGPRNGVLTAVEDFVASWPAPIQTYTVPLFHGLTVLIPRSRMTEAISQAAAGLLAEPALLDTCLQLQERYATLLADLAASRQRTVQLGEALMRARSRLVGPE